MIPRDVSKKVMEFSKQYPVVTITGPRQSGKTTLCKMLFPNKPYVSLENIDNREFAENDPIGFLEMYPKGVIIDEIQRVPDLTSYIQTIVDEKDLPGMYILTGSQQFELINRLSQSLAGRTALIRLLPFSFSEVYGIKKNQDIDKVLTTGFYPRIFDKGLDPYSAMEFYISTYIERDLRQLINIKDLSRFQTFLKLCAGRTGQILNMSSIGNECGISHNTVNGWLTILEASYIIKRVKPFYKNFNKRLVKAPKLFFIDTGLACFLLGISSFNHLQAHPLKGALFETFVFSELLKTNFNQAKPDNIYYFRDNIGNEIDFILDAG
ncbi:MAG: ATP-binding protein, partial [Desulfobacula sp.]|uniref:ATP-binding protein n=1 Tax=Desulfobacula sp. TaxID=2593537 RepID=UPI0025C5F228